MARQEGKTKSQLIREALRQYQFEKNLEKMQEIGEKIAARMGIETYEDIEKIGG